MKTGAFLMLAGAVLSGCSTYAASRYTTSVDTVTALRGFRGTSVAVAPFTSAKPGETEITCRAVGPIKTPDGEPFEQFVRKALIDEMKMAEIYADSGPVTLTGRLESIDFSSGLTDAAWNIALTLTSSNGKSLAVAERYEYKSSWYGERVRAGPSHRGDVGNVDVGPSHRPGARGCSDAVSAVERVFTRHNPLVSKSGRLSRIITMRSH